jgi:hypothetical protein
VIRGNQQRESPSEDVNVQLTGVQQDVLVTVPGDAAMNILKHLRLRTKLAIVMAMLALALVASIAMAASVMRARLLEDRVAVPSCWRREVSLRR